MTHEFEALARHGRNAVWRYLVTGVLALVFASLLAAAILLPLQLAGVIGADIAARMQDPSDLPAFFGGVAVTFICLLVGLLLAARWVQGKRARDLIGPWRWGTFAIGAAVWGVVLVLAIGLDMLLAPSGFSVTADHRTPSLAVWALLALAPQIFAEEVVFRGWITQGLLLGLRRPLVAAVISGLIFGSVHIPNGLPQAVSATIFGVMLALLAMRLGGVAFTSGIHFINNVFGAVVVTSAQDVFKGVPGLVAQSTPQLMWVDVASAAVGLGLVTAVVWRRGLRPMKAENHAPAGQQAG